MSFCSGEVCYKAKSNGYRTDFSLSCVLPSNLGAEIEDVMIFSELTSY